MKTLELKRKKSVLRSAAVCITLMYAALLMVTACGTSSTVTESYGSAPPEYRLTDDCALLHIYRPGSMMGFAIKYDLHLGDMILCNVSNKSKVTVKLTNPGLIVLWAKTESTTELPINIEMGREYYIRCGLDMGIVVGRPSLTPVDNVVGKYEFDKIPWKKK